jgi:hypothetical protein
MILRFLAGVDDNLIMENTFGRLLTAMMMSFTMAVATVWLYYHRGKELKFVSKAKPIARITRTENEILLRPSGHLIWQEVGRNDYIYPGEAIRTLKNSSAQVEFLNDGTKIDIEPESVVVIDQTIDKMQLDFLSGSMLVNNAKSKTGALVVSSGGKVLPINQSQTIFSGDAKNGVSVDEIGKEDQSLISIVKPEYLSHFLQDAKNSKDIEFSWRSQNSFEKIELWLGPERARLTKFMDISNKQLADGIENLQIEPGRHYWQLRGNSQGKISVSTVRSIVINKFNPPVLLEPREGQKLEKLIGHSKIFFKWVNKNLGYGQKIQLSQDMHFQKVLSEKEVELSNEALVELKNPGKYFWRVQTYSKNNDSSIFTSEIHNFNLVINNKLSTPNLVFPAENEIILAEKAKTLTLRFNWDSVEDAKEYQFNLSSANGYAIESVVSENQLLLTDLKEGEYNWFLEARSAENIKSAISEKFYIHSMDEIGWLEPHEVQLKLKIKNPEILVAWNNLNLPNTEYIFKARSTEINKLPLFEKKLKETAFGWVGAKIGKYELSVEAVGPNNRRLGLSRPMLIEVMSPDLIEAPEIINTNKNSELKTSNTGDLVLKWTKVNEAKVYEVVMKDEKGKVFLYKALKNYVHFKKLNPGTYKVYVYAIDMIKRKSEKSPSQTIVVPNESDALPPELRKVKIR